MADPRNNSKPNPPSAVGVAECTVPSQEAWPGSTPRTALQSLVVRPVPIGAAKSLILRNHYLRSLPGGTQLAFGVFRHSKMLGALTLGAGPTNAYRLVRTATRDDCATLTRLWLADALPKNSESRVLGIVLRGLRRHTCLKFLMSYADPTQGHVGTIYQATGWIYTGLSDATPTYRLGADAPRHSRTVSALFGTRSAKHFEQQGIELARVPVSPKHRYVRFLDPTWRERLNVPELLFPKQGESP